MSVKDDGGSAFPFKADTNEGPVTLPGMTLRDWFATHAPQPAPDWFKPKWVGNKPEELGLDSLSKEGRKIYLERVSLVSAELTEEVEEYIKKKSKKYKEIIAWEENYEIEKFRQWPWHYAEMMLKARGE